MTKFSAILNWMKRLLTRKEQITLDPNRKLEIPEDAWPGVKCVMLSKEELIKRFPKK